ncbi:MAG: SRPBCC family protein [Dehalococcoidales bacterium]|nr:SRPBCC family protein [Dehalococcoidales bacterium]
MRIHRSIEIAALAERIWPLLVEPEQILKWCLSIKEIRHTSGQHGGLSTSFYFEEKAVGQLMKLNFVVTEWVVNKKVAFRMTSGNLVKGYQQRYVIEAIPSGSRVTCFEEVKLPYGILGKAAGLFRRFVSGAHLEAMLANLKALAEV